MNILIIGNGFDLAHGLPTRYWDFLMFVKYARYNGSLIGLGKVSGFKHLNENIQSLCDSRGYLDSDNNKQLFEFQNIIKDNVWIDYFINKIIGKIIYKENGWFCFEEDKNKGWIDFELEISHVVQSLDCIIRYNKEVNRIGKEAKEENKKLYKDGRDFVHKNLQKALRGHKSLDFEIEDYEDEIEEFYGDEIEEFYGDKAKIVIDKLVKDLSKLIRCLEIYLDEFVGKIRKDIISPDIREISELDGGIDKVLSFNYTQTYKEIYDSDKNIEYDYVHGQSNSKRDESENNMVLGIDEYLDDKKKDKELDFIQFKKYFQRIYKKTGCEYRKWVEKIKEEKVKTNLYIFGHSLDITDKDILRELIMLPTTTTTIYYHDNDAYKQYIVNLVKLIGQDELTDCVHGSNPKIKFKLQTNCIQR